MESMATMPTSIDSGIVVLAHQAVAKVIMSNLDMNQCIQEECEQ